MKFQFVASPPTVLDDFTAADYQSPVVEATPVLRRSSLEAAVQFGGPAVRELLEAVQLVGDKKYVSVDTKVTFLMPGWYPAIPGWHTDGVPRGGICAPTPLVHPGSTRRPT